MIFSFSVPEKSTKYSVLIQWYKNIEPQERSRLVRDILLRNLMNEQQPEIPAKKLEPVSPVNKFSQAQIQRVNISEVREEEEDLDLKFKTIGVRSF